MESILGKYLKNIEKALKRGTATEHTYRPALKELIESLKPKIIATNEPKRVECGAPDFVITKGATPIGYIECKDVGKSLDIIEKDAYKKNPTTGDGNQLKRYLEGLGNLILTNYLEFRWYVEGQLRLNVYLAKIGKNQSIQTEKDSIENLGALLNEFLQSRTPTIKSPKELAERMSALARLIRELISNAFKQEDKGGSLHQQMEAFKEVLIHDLTTEQFADMYAQTICYGLFAARCSPSAIDRIDNGQTFTREQAAWDIPKTNPFLREVFSHICGPDLDDRLVWIVDDLVELLARADIAGILEDFGKRTRQEDPVVHFYETFLSAYNPKLRKTRGVYYTPEPVVSYIVRSVDYILKEDFGIKDGLADTQKIPFYKSEIDAQGEIKREKAGECHKVLILDPAVGTGTFLYSVINQIYEHIQQKGQAGVWSDYVTKHLLPRIFGFELLIAPYAVAHMKLGIQLQEFGYDFQSNERLRIYLTNTLDEASKIPDFFFATIIAREAQSANEVKKDSPVMVILGNPPYSGQSTNVGDWIKYLLKGRDLRIRKKTHNYFEVDGNPLGERQSKWLNDDYVKFIRFAQWRIEQTGYGILAFITNHGYLDNPTFRGMRQCLIETFDDIYILDLHGNAKKKEVCPDGAKDENVFDIQQGVAIGIFLKKQNGKKEQAKVKHSEIWGLREIFDKNHKLIGGKYHWLYENELNKTEWTELKPQSPFYLFIPQNIDLKSEYDNGWKIKDIMPLNSVGIVTARDHLTIRWSKEEIWETVKTFVSMNPEEAREKFNLGKDAGHWKVSLAQEDLKNTGPSKDKIIPVLYRPFDKRYTYYTGKTRGFLSRPLFKVMRHLIEGNNIALITSRLTKGETFKHIQVSRNITEVICMSPNTSNNGFLFPLYIFPKDDLENKMKGANLPQGRKPNLSEEFIKIFTGRLNLNFIPEGKGDLKVNFGPEDVFDYIYAVFHSHTYRNRYVEFLKIDFPRVPLTSNLELFRELCILGEELVALHLMDKFGPEIASFPVKLSDNDSDNCVVDKVTHTEPTNNEKGKVWINKKQYFEGVPENVWEFHIGGYQVCKKWLKYRKGRKLTFDDITHYQHIISVLSETIGIMGKIDEVIDKHGGWPIK